MWKLIANMNFLIYSQYWLLGAKPTSTNTTTHTKIRRQVNVSLKQVFAPDCPQHMTHKFGNVYLFGIKFKELTLLRTMGYFPF